MVHGESKVTYPVVDELLPSGRRKDLNFSSMVLIARKPAVDEGFSTAPEPPLPPRRDRFDIESFDPRVETPLRWRWACVHKMPDVVCPRCKSDFPEGMMVCVTCGLCLSTMTDMRRACQVIRLEELASRIGFNFTLDLIGDDVARGNTGAGTTRVKSCLTVLRDHAKSYMKQARKSGRTLIQRFNEDPMFQYNCAVQDITPQCLDFIRDLGRTEVPKLDRTAEEIRSGKIRQFKAKLCLVNDEDSDELDVNKHILIWFRNRFYRIGQFAAAYAQFDLQDRFTVLSFLEKIWSSDGLNGDEVLEDLLVFIEENVSKPLQMRQGTGRRSLLPAPNISPKDQQCTAPSFLGGKIGEEETIRLRSGMHTTPDGPTRSGRDGAWSIPVTHTAVIVGQHLAIGDLGTEQSRRELLAIAEMRESGLYFALIRLPSVHDS